MAIIPYQKWLLNLCALVGLGAITGCAAHTINHTPQPQVETPAAFISYKDTNNKTVTLHAPWWESFERPVLEHLITQSFTQNQNLAAAVANLKQAQATARQTQSQALPQINAEGDANKSWNGSDARRGTAEIGAALEWELDVWGRISAAAKADSLLALARQEDVEALKLSLSAEIANAYFGAVAARQRVDLLKDQLKLDRDLQDLLQLRLDSGVGTSVDVMQQQARVADSQTLIPLAEADLAVFENRLDVLLGTMPDAKRRIPATENLTFTQHMPAIGVPAALLFNRPDLRAAKAELIAADADIAAAIADRLPQITLDGSYVYADTATYTGPVSMIMGAFVQPILDWGRRKAEVERNKALYEEKLAAYTQLYLEAVEAVENALIRETKQREFLKKLNIQKDILQKTVNASEDRYTQGIDDYQPVISALQELRVVERALVAEQLTLVNIRIELFRAIGGPMTHSQKPPETKDNEYETL